MVGVSRLLTLKRTALAIAVLFIAVAVAGKLASAALSVGPAASFTYSPSAPKSGDNVSFNSTSTDDGTIQDHAWDFGDGNTGTGTGPTHKYPIPGSYTVKLTVTDDEALSDTSQQTVTVANRDPSAEFHWDPASPVIGETVFFTSTASDPENRLDTQKWDLDNDGVFTDDSGATASRAFSSPGPHPISLMVTDKDGGVSTLTRTVDVIDPPNELPHASFSFTPAAPHILDNVKFTSGSTDTDGTISTTEWDLDNDSIYESSGKEVTRQFFLAGTYTVNLRVTDNEGGIDTASKTVTVSELPNEAPVAQFRFSPSSPKTNETITFTSEATDDGGVALEEWDFDGDGAYDTTGHEVQFSYPAADTYKVGLRVTDNKGVKSTTTKDVKVVEPPNNPPTAAFRFSPASPKSGEPITFTSESTDDGAINSLEWDFENDGAVDATGNEVQHAYPVPGAYTVRLRVTDDKGVSREATKSVTAANRQPSADFTYSPASPQKGQQISFSSLATDPENRVQTVMWDLDGDNTFEASGITAVKTFTTPGDHTVRLRITDRDGGSATASKTISIPSQPPVASFDISPAAPMTGDTVTFTSTSTDADGTVTDFAWDTNGDGKFNDGNDIIAERVFTSAGDKVVRLQIKDDDGNTVVTSRTVTVQARPNVAPNAVIDAPTAAVKGQPVTFKSLSTDSDGTIAATEWALDPDGLFNDGTGAQVTRTFTAAGLKTIKLRVRDNSGATDVATADITIGGNAAPVAQFTMSPSAPRTGDAVTFSSTSTDSDGTVQSLAWDLDNDGLFDDSSKTSVTKTFSSPGRYPIRLKATDNDNDWDIATLEVVVRVPVPVIDMTPVAPLSQEQVTFSVPAIQQVDPSGTLTTVVWDLDGDNTFEATGASAPASFPRKGSYTVRVKVDDKLGTPLVATRVVDVANRAPLATFSYQPAAPNPREVVTLTSTSMDPEDGPVGKIEWDTDNDGIFDDGTGLTAQRTFTAPGNRTVRIRATDTDGAQTVGSQVIVIGNRPPVASFDYRPSVPIAEQQVTFFSTSDDPDKNIERVDWDLDGDGSFETAGGTAGRAFPAGSFNISVRVTDTSGAFSIATQTIVVSAPAPASQAPHISSDGPQLRLLNPFPIVRIAGRIGRAGTRFRLLTVNAPEGATVMVRCAGRGCPFKASRRSATTARVVRIRKLEKRLLRSGATIRVFVTKPGVIGKFTSIRIRKGKPPRRTDRCLMPDNNTKPVKCPS